MTKRAGVKKTEYDKRVLEYRDSRKDNLNKAELAWLLKFEREEYANDHAKQGSLYREALGNDYTDKKYKNIYGQDISLEQVKYSDYNRMMRDLTAVARTFDEDDDGSDKEEKDLEKRVTLDGKSYEEYQDFVDFSGFKEDKSTIAALLKHYHYKEVFSLMIKDAAYKIDYAGVDTTLHLEQFAYKIMILAMKARYQYNKTQAVEKAAKREENKSKLKGKSKNKKPKVP